MGQRFQVYTKTGNKGIIGFHLQWCWGTFSLIRATQVLEFAKGDFKNKYSLFKEDIYKNEVEAVLSGLIGLNHEYKSYVAPYLLKHGETKNPSLADNNDGCLLLDLTGDKPKYCFFDPYTINPVAMNGLEYILYDYRYEYEEEEYKYKRKLIDKHLKKLSKFEVLTTDELKNTFPDMYNLII